MVLLFLFQKTHLQFLFALFATVHFWEDFPSISTRKGRGRRRILRVWGLGREPQQARKAGAQRRIFRKWRAICPACHFCGKGNLARHLHCLPNLPFEKIFSICETKCHCIPYYPYRRTFQKFFAGTWNKISLSVILVNRGNHSFEKSSLGFWTF